jgi:hypothetical protein
MLHLPVSNANSQLSVELYELFTRGFAAGEESMPGLVDADKIDGTQDEPPIPKPTGKEKAATPATDESSGKGQPPNANKKGKSTAAKKATDASNGKDEPPIANKKRKSTATNKATDGTNGKDEPPIANKKGKSTAKKATDERNSKDEPPIANKKKSTAATKVTYKTNSSLPTQHQSSIPNRNGANATLDKSSLVTPEGNGAKATAVPVNDASHSRSEVVGNAFSACSERHVPRMPARQPEIGHRRSRIEFRQGQSESSSFNPTISISYFLFPLSGSPETEKEKKRPRLQLVSYSSSPEKDDRRASPDSDDITMAGLEPTRFQSLQSTVNRQPSPDSDISMTNLVSANSDLQPLRSGSTVNRQPSLDFSITNLEPADPDFQSLRLGSLQTVAMTRCPSHHIVGMKGRRK